MNYLKHGLGDEHGFQHDLRKRKTPLSEMQASARGAIEVSLQTTPGLCQLHRKCILKEGHTVPCWPGD